MASIIIMPKQGLQMTEGILVNWLVEEGGTVIKDKPLFEMETDKLNITMDAAEGGTLLKILHDVGDVVPITEPIAIIGNPGEDIAELLVTCGAAEAATAQTAAAAAVPAQAFVTTAATPDVVTYAAPEGPVYASPRAKTTADEKHLDYRQLPGSGPEGFIIERDVLAFEKATPKAVQAISVAPAASAAPAPEQPKATPLARTIAAQEGAVLKDIAGTGSHGKITHSDVLANIAGRVAQKAGTETRGETKIPMTAMRKVVATRMKQSLTEMAQANHRMDVDMTEAVKLREQLKAADIKISYNDIVLRCAAKALTEYPMMNASMTDDGFILKNYINLGMAVAVEGGLIVPVVHDADLMTLQEISAVAADLAAKAKEKRLMPDEFSGGTFTVTNLGMFDITSFTPIINPPEAGILGVGKMEKRAVVVGDQVVVRQIMTLSLTYDHRVVDGAPAAQFLRRVKQLLQAPALLL